MYSKYEKLRAVVDESRIWSGNQAKTHAFLLSPSVYTITEAQRTELQQLGYAISDCLLGLSHMGVIAYDQSLNYKGAWQTVRKVFSTGVPKVYQELQGMFIKEIPQLLKVDLMLTPQNCFKIAEIDGHNKHGLGYSTLGKRFRDTLYPDAKALPGAVKTLAEFIKRRGHTQLKLFYADQERFYVPEFRIARQEFEKEGCEVLLLNEMSATPNDLSTGLFLDLPFLYKRQDLYNTIIPAYKEGAVKFVIPPKPCLGAKGVLALLRNDMGDQHLESLLRTFIKQKSLDTVRQYIPETLLVGKMAEGVGSVQQRIEKRRYVLKESISSGMKGTVFSDDHSFTDTLEEACATNLNWILQEEVLNQSQNFQYYIREPLILCDDGQEPGVELMTAYSWFMRVTAHYVNSQLADIMVTARRDKAVHGAPDCLQIGTIIV